MARARWCAARLALLSLLLFSLPPPAAAQEIRYEYDPLGRLVLVVSPEGVARYEYDAVGNILRITTRRYADVSGPVAILALNPTRGAPGTSVEILGRGFSPTAASNQVTFNGAPASVTSATERSLLVDVPDGATTGPVRVATTLGSATSEDVFVVLLPFAVVPAEAEVAFRGGLELQALVGGTPAAAVTWSVNGVIGGNDQYGRITPGGVYTAPQTVAQTVDIAAALAEPTRVAHALVHVVAPSGLFAAPWVTVGPALPPPTANPLAALVSVGSPPPPLGADPLPSAPIGVAPADSLRAMPLAVPGLAVARRPVVTGVIPTAATRGTTVLVTLTGAGLEGLTGLAVLKAGAADPDTSVSELAADPSGTQATATLFIAGTAAPGSRILQVIVGSDRSTVLGTGRNVLTVQ
jgi:YD repeat-containing protein